MDENERRKSGSQLNCEMAHFSVAKYRYLFPVWNKSGYVK